MLDEDLRDKEQQNAILRARNKILEEKHNQELLNKYFPNSSSDTQGQNSHTRTFCHSCPSPRPPSSLPTCPSWPRQPARPSHCCLHTPPSHSNSTGSSEIEKRLKKFENHLKEVKETLATIQKDMKTSALKQTTQNLGTNTTTIAPDMDISIASVEEFMPDILETSNEDLNSSDPTNQLLQLMPISTMPIL